MRVTTLDLEYYRCFEEASVSLDPGVTVIHGPNGAGKTTLLESMLFALYGARALDDATLEDVMTQGADTTRVELGFLHEGGEYTIDREVAVVGERVSTRQCELTLPDGELIEGVKAVRAHITDLIRMDGDAFVNCAYVKQGEINKLLHASPGERQSMIDDLLQLGKLERYRDRSDHARRAARALRIDREERLEDLTNQIDRRSDPDPHEKLNELETELRKVEAQLDRHRDRRDTLTEERSSIEDHLTRVEDKQAELEALEDKREDLIETINQTEEDRRELRETLQSSMEERTELRESIADELEAVTIDDPAAIADALEETAEAIDSQEAEIEEVRTAVEETRSQKAEVEERIDNLTSQLATITTEREELQPVIESDETVLEQWHDELADIEDASERLEEQIEAHPIDPDDIETVRETREEALTACEEAIQETRETIAAVRSRIEEAESLAADDRCPTCGQPVEDSPHLEHLEDDRQQLDTLESELAELIDRREDIAASIEAVEELTELLEQRETLETKRESKRQLIDERNDALADRRERDEALQTRAETLRRQLDEAKQDAAAADERMTELRSNIAEANQRLQTLRSRRQTLETLRQMRSDLESLSERISEIRKRLDQLDDLQTERQARLEDIEESIDDLTADLDKNHLEELRSRRETIDEEVDTLEATIEDLHDRRDRLNESLGSVRQTIEELESLRERKATLKTRRDDLQHLEAEIDDLGELYGTVRSELREQNVRTLEQLLNETFELLYRNDAYDRIELDRDYELTIYQKDDTALDPLQLSGGERAIFNLSLRCAIYRLLAKGVEGATPLPPLMLDEPTVFLDAGHVQRLLRLLEAMRQMGVEQTLVVSHHETLLDAAEQHVTVEKDPTSNRSHVHQRPTPIPGE